MLERAEGFYVAAFAGASDESILTYSIKGGEGGAGGWSALKLRSLYPSLHDRWCVLSFQAAIAG